MISSTRGAGVSWSTPKVIYDEAQSTVSQLQIVANDRSRLLAVWALTLEDEHQIVYAISDDFGFTWSPCKQMFTHSKWHNIDGITHLQAVYTGYGQWLTVWMFGSGCMSKSFDDGETWSELDGTISGSIDLKVMGSNLEGTLLGTRRRDIYPSSPDVYWRSDNRILEPPSRLTDEDYGEEVLSISGPYWLKVDGDSVYGSIDNARSWILRSSIPGLDQASDVKLGMSPDLKTLVLAAAFQSPAPHLKIYRSPNIGESWTVADLFIDGMPLDGSLNLKWGRPDSWILGYTSASGGDRYSYSLDNGANWAQLKTGEFGANFVASHSNVVSVFSSSDATGLKIYSTRAVPVAPSSAADWQLFE